MTTTTKTYTSILHFNDNEHMDHAEYGASIFINPSIFISSESHEFDGDEEYEVVIITSKPIPQTSINKYLKHINTPTNYTFNQ